MKKIFIAAFAISATTGISVSKNVSAEDFFAKKQLVMTVAAAAGGGFNAYGRNIARYIVKYIPGEPTVIVKNMPGAGGRKSVDWLDKLAPKDGSNFLASQPGALVEPILGDPKRVKYQPLKFGYMGSAAGFTTLCLLRTDHPAKSFKDMLTMPTVFGGDQIGSTTHDHANMMRNLVGAKIKLVKGYSGTKNLVLAIQQKEVDGFCGYAWASLMSRAPYLVTNKVVRLVVQFGLDAHPGATAAGVPPVWDFVTNKRDIAALKLLASVQVFGRPYVLPAGVPKERLAILQKAFDATMKDPDFLADMKKRKLDISPTSGPRVKELIEAIYLAPKDIQKHARWAIATSK